MQTAVASLLDMTLDEVPHFAEADDWWAAYLKFIQDHHLHLTVYAPRFEIEAEYEGGYLATAPFDQAPTAPILIACGYSPRGFYHDVLWRGGIGGAMIHDPHPSQAGFTSDPDQFWLITPSHTQALLELANTEGPK
jgi:hypothetical protein